VKNKLYIRNDELL